MKFKYEIKYQSHNISIYIKQLYWNYKTIRLALFAFKDFKVLQLKIIPTNSFSSWFCLFLYGYKMICWLMNHFPFPCLPMPYTLQNCHLCKWRLCTKHAKRTSNNIQVSLEIPATRDTALFCSATTEKLFITAERATRVSGLQQVFLAVSYWTWLSCYQLVAV